MRFPTKSEMLAGLGAYNSFLADYWRKRGRELTVHALETAQRIAEHDGRLQDLANVALDANAPPELTFEESERTPNRITARLGLPGKGAWRFSFRARVPAKPSVFGRQRAFEVRVERFRMEAVIELAQKTPVSAKSRHVAATVSIQGLRIGRRHWLRGSLALYLKDVLTEIARETARELLIFGQPGPRATWLSARPIRREGASCDLAGLESRATSLTEQIAKHHTPWRAVLSAVVPRDNPNGRPESFAGFADSALWTGCFAAAESYRYALNGAPEALDNVHRALTGLETLLGLGRCEGVPARAYIPVKSPHAKALRTEAERLGQGEWLYEAKHRGVAYLTWGGARPAHWSAALFGAAMAGFYAAERSKTRDLAGRILCGMADGLLGGSEPGVTANGRIAYAPRHPGLILAALQAARRFQPKRYGDEFERLYTAWPTLWFFNWLMTIDPHRDEGALLTGHLASLALLKLERDPIRRDHLAQGLLALRLALRRQGNALFDLIELDALHGELAHNIRDRAGLEKGAAAAIIKASARSERPAENEDTAGSSRPQSVFWPIRGQIEPAEGKSLRTPRLDWILPYWMARVCESYAEPMDEPPLAESN